MTHYDKDALEAANEWTASEEGQHALAEMRKRTAAAIYELVEERKLSDKFLRMPFQAGYKAALSHSSVQREEAGMVEVAMTGAREYFQTRMGHSFNTGDMVNIERIMRERIQAAQGGKGGG